MSIENTKVPVTTELPILSKERNISEPNEVKQPIVIENKEEEKEKINDKEETKKTNLLFAKKNISPIHLICHLSGKFEIFLMIIGIISSFGTGIAAPLMTYLFGDLLGDFSCFTSIDLTTLPLEQVNVLFSEYLVYDPEDPKWTGRDRFFLDPGHMSPMLYSGLALRGYFSMEDLKQFRQWDSVTPGHPELDVERGVENSSGPLGQGHAMAAGLSLSEEHLEELEAALNEDAGLKAEDLIEKICIDVPMPLTYISVPLIEQLSVLEPCGNGNEKPVFADRELVANRAFYIGKEHNMLKLQMACGSGSIDALYFGDAEEFLDHYRKKYGADQVDALLQGRPQQIRFAFVYYPQINRYQGRNCLQIVVSHYA